MIERIKDPPAKEFFEDLYDRYLMESEERDMLENLALPREKRKHDDLMQAVKEVISQCSNPEEITLLFEKARSNI
jgi:hypothetical protein